ncbi:hypothetical protein AgCh_002998 [Apium graveolens]
MADLKSPPSHPPSTVTVRRNPPRRARPTPSQTPIPLSLPPTPSTIPSFPINDILSIEIPENNIVKNIENENLKVFLRIRPISISQPQSRRGEKAKNVWPQSKQIVKPKVKKISEVCLKENDEHSVTLCPPQSMQDQKRSKTEVYEGFSYVFSADSSQDDVFDKMVNPIVEDFMKGKSGMLAALGPSGSGKTHTIFGTTRQPGMIPLALRRIFLGTEGNGAQSSRTFYLSMFEICSERGRSERMIDLFNDGVDICLQQSTIKGLHESVVCDVQQAEALIAEGMLKRATAMTNSNSQSSRSQCIINIRCETCGDVQASSNSALLTIVDLAGAEREKKTGNQGHRLLESNFINNTSMVFGLCLRSLLEHQKNRKKPMQKHFKNSLLTRYLRDYLEGKKRMALILTVKPGEEDYLDASFLLRQAAPFMKIKFTNSEESTELIGNKRHFQPFLKADQQKKMKMSTNESSAVNDKSADVLNSTPYEKECEHEVTMKKVNEVDDTRSRLLAESPKTLKSEVDDSIFVSDNINASKRNRLSQIMQGFAIAAWEVLKQYKEKLKVAEKEIYCLKQSLDDEKAKSDRLAKELAHLKSAFLCENIVSADKIVTKEVGCRGNGLDGPAESDHKPADSHELAGASSVNLSEPELRANNQITDSFIRSSSLVSTSCVDREISEDQNCQVAGVSSINLSESAVTMNNQNTDSGVSTSVVAEEIFEGHSCQHVESPAASEGVESLEGQEDSNCNGDVLEIFEGHSCQHVEFPVPSEGVESLEGKEDSNHKDNVPLEGSANCIQPSILKSDDSSSLVEGHRSQNDAEKKRLDQTAISNNVPEVAVEVVPCPRPPNAEKPKRRLQPASSMLLKNISGLDIEDETEKPKGAKGSKRNMGLDLTTKTQGSLSLIRLLKNNV